MHIALPSFLFDMIIVSLVGPVQLKPLLTETQRNANWSKRVLQKKNNIFAYPLEEPATNLRSDAENNYGVS
jgi:hypothetical protein